MKRVIVPEMEAILGEAIPVLDDGHIMLVDYMGDDSSIVQAARVSYGEGTKKIHEDRGLIRYLMRHRHTTPFEMCEVKLRIRVPMDCWRQWIRHRTACLAGDVELVFNRPSDSKPYRLTVKEVFDRFQPTANTARPEKQRNPLFKRERVQSMKLRCLDEGTGLVNTTSVIDIWQSGVKEVFKVTLRGGRSIRCSKDHRIYTPSGWKTLKEISVGDKVMTISSRYGLSKPMFNFVDQESEQWQPIVGWEEYYEVSDQGRVRRIVGGRGSRSHGMCKKLTVSNRRAVTSLNKPGEQTIILVHREMLRAFVGEPDDGLEACHKDGNSLNNVLDNLCWGTSKDNGEDMVSYGTSTYLTGQTQSVVSIEPDGEEMTYDLEVSGRWHNFSANDFVVHNSVNEYSTRYSEAIDACQRTPIDKWRLQSCSNKQGSGGALDRLDGDTLSAAEERLHKHARDVYETRLRMGVAREQARKDLPLSNYTEAYWKIDLHNLLNFLRLRCDSHAQYEIRQYANAIRDQILAVWCPLVYEAFIDYSTNGVFLTGPEIDIIRTMYKGGDVDEVAVRLGLKKWKNDQLVPTREFEELQAKMVKMGIET